ncbi:MAG: metalloregulator ArsR/SmtB family transcription factor [Candidatus Paceibacterota bacterium]
MTTASQTIEDQARLFKMLSSTTRLAILRVLVESNGELCVNEIAEHVGTTQSNASHQLSKLEDNEIVACVRYGQTSCYHITDSPEAQMVRNFLKHSI